MFVSAAASPGHMGCWQRRRGPKGGVDGEERWAETREGERCSGAGLPLWLGNSRPDGLFEV